MARNAPLILTKSGQVPTASKFSSQSYLAEGESAYNEVDKLFYVRYGGVVYRYTLAQILEAVRGVWNFIENPDIIVPILNQFAGILYVIESGVTVIVNNDYQYFLDDTLYLSGGDIWLEGNAELIVNGKDDPYRDRHLYRIKNGKAVTVEDDAQYFIKDNLFLETGGSIYLQGTAELIV